MKAAIFRGGDLVVDTIPDPVPALGQVLVKTLACGICGSDLHAAKHAHRMVEVTKRIPGRKPMDLSRDIVFGHEFCCEVLDYGPKTEKRIKPGTRVCSMPLMVEADGPKGMGYSNTYVGGYAERMVLSAPLMLEVPNGLPTEHAALTEPLAVGVHAVEKANLAGDEAPLVVGCGPVGLAVIAGLKLKDALIVETKNSEWTLVFAAREDRKDDPEIRKFISIYRSAPVKAFIEEKFKGSILPTW